MGLDIRLPIGLMFVVLGPIILITGLVRGESLSIRTGGSMCVFGVFMLVMGVRGQKRANAEALAETPPDPGADEVDPESGTSAAARSVLAEETPDSAASALPTVDPRAALVTEETAAQI